MQLINRRTNRTVSREARLLTTWGAQARGLMFTRRRDDFCLIFAFPTERKMTFHMWFVPYPIDIVFLDKDKRVIELKERLLPFSAYTTHLPLAAAIELPQGWIKRHRISYGDVLAWKTI